VLKRQKDLRAGKEVLKTGNMIGIGAIVKSICFTEGRSSDFESEAVETMNKTLCLEKQDLD
jgi:hypothetical protein